MNAFDKHIEAANKEYWATTNKPELRSMTDNIQPPPAEPPPADQHINPAADPDLGKMFTKKQVQRRSDWEEWRQSSHKQLDQ
mmetsp:Transcript_21319/g.30477  ORF Transcript_21319/g.30477 Transcript_21319/m.30477 type:complete len:82 (+) Transcript_21319:232-477(+)